MCLWMKGLQSKKEHKEHKERVDGIKELSLIFVYKYILYIIYNIIYSCEEEITISKRSMPTCWIDCNRENFADQMNLNFYCYYLSLKVLYK